jgi:hypothetical protein
MMPSPLLRRALLAIAIVLLLGLAWTGLSGGVNQLNQPQSRGQFVQTIMQVVYGFFALATVLTTFWARRWASWMLAGWVVSLTLAAALASVVWGDTSLVIGVLSGAAALAIALAIGWLLRIGARGLTSERS